MLRNITDLRGYTSHPTGGDRGTVKDFDCDDDGCARQLRRRWVPARGAVSPAG